MHEKRPDPNELLRRVVGDSSRQARGKLTVFFGAAPGVGKTYAMVEAARSELEREKRDVVVGIVETHGRYETGALLRGLELLPRAKRVHRGVSVEDLNLDAALQRRPELILVDDLAHTNAEGSRHSKRWQDVEELLDAGIDVFSTLNVQHVESLNDVIAKVTGVVVRETVPDTVLERAHELKLVDLPPDDLLERLRDGKVYVPALAQRALENFFKKGNLIALRELALRHTAQRVDAQMQAFRRVHRIEQTWAVSDQILVAVSPSPYSARLVRAARRIAGALHARWFAVYVEPPAATRPSACVQARLSQNLRLAEQLGAEVVTLSGESAAEEILSFARERNITKVILGKPTLYRWSDRFRPSLVDRIVRTGGDIDVYVTAGDRDPDGDAAEKPFRARIELPSFLAATLASAAATGVALLFGPDQLPDVVMIYLLGIMLVSSRYGLGTSIFTAFLSVAAFDFLFVPPFLTFAVADLRHAVTFAVMFLVAIVISGLTERLRNQASAARVREERTRRLHALSRELTGAHGTERVIFVSAAHIERAFACRVHVFVPGSPGALTCAYASPSPAPMSEEDASIAAWVFANEKEAGLGTTTLPDGSALYVPLMASGGIVGVLGLCPAERHRFDDIEQRRQVDAFAAPLALAIERAELAGETDRARLEIEREQLRSSLLSSVSHDLRTPLAVVTGAASTLLDHGGTMPESTRAELVKTIFEEAERLNRLIRNLLDMTRLESGAINIRKEWSSLEEIVGAALSRVDARFAGREIDVKLPEDLPLVAFDPVLIEQVLINLLENAAKYALGPVEIRAELAAGELVVDVSDRGPGIPAPDQTRIFEKFYRLRAAGSAGGVGLGLAICRAIVTAHGGRIAVSDRAGGGAVFRFAVPVHGAPPELALREPLDASTLDGQS